MVSVTKYKRNDDIKKRPVGVPDGCTIVYKTSACTRVYKVVEFPYLYQNSIGTNFVNRNSG
jgi:hypothetical protein